MNSSEQFEIKTTFFQRECYVTSIHSYVTSIHSALLNYLNSDQDASSSCESCTFNLKSSALLLSSQLTIFFQHVEILSAVSSLSPLVQMMTLNHGQVSCLINLWEQKHYFQSFHHYPHHFHRHFHYHNPHHSHQTGFWNRE